MATKFYLHDATTTNTGTLPSGEHSSLTSNGSATPPATNTTQRSMDTTIGTSQTSLAGTTQATTTAQAMLMGMWESAPLAAQTLPTGTWTLSYAQKEAAAAANYQVTFCLYVWRPSTGAMVGSVLYDHGTNGAEGGTSENAKTFTTGSVTGVAVLDGDILVCEIWRDSVAQANANARLITFYYDGATEASTTDCASFLLCNGGTISFLAVEDSPGLEVSGFGSFSDVGSRATINHVQVDVAEFQSVTGHPATFELWDNAATLPVFGSTDSGYLSSIQTAIGTVHGYRGYNGSDEGTNGVPASWPGTLEGESIPAGATLVVISLQPDVTALEAGSLDAGLAAYFADIATDLDVYIACWEEGESDGTFSTPSQLIADTKRVYDIFTANAPPNAKFGQIPSSAAIYSGNAGYPLDEKMCTATNGGEDLDWYGIDLYPAFATSTPQGDYVDGYGGGQLSVLNFYDNAGVPTDVPHIITETNAVDFWTEGAQDSWFSGVWEVAQEQGITAVLTYWNGTTGIDYEVWPPDSATIAELSLENSESSTGEVRIGAIQTGTASTDTANVSTANFTGVTYSQLANLAVRVYGHLPTGETESVDSVTLTVNYTPSPDAAVIGVGAEVVVAGGIGSVTADGGPEVVQTTAFNNGFSGTFDTPVTAGNTILLMASGHSSGGADLSHDPLYGGSAVTGATKAVEEITGTTDAYVALWVLPNVSGSSDTISITVDNSDDANYVGVIALEVSGLGSSPVVDKFNSGTATSSSASSGSTGAITGAPEIIFGSIVQDSLTDTPAGSPWTNIFLPGNDGHNSYAGYQIVTSSGGSYTYTGTGGSSDWVAAIIAVAPGSGGTDASVAGVGAAITVAGGVGSVKASAKITGVGASITVAGGIGSNTSTSSAAVTGVGAAVTVAGGIGSLTTTDSAAITGVGASVTIAGGIGSTTTTDSATVTGVGAAIAVAGGVGSASSDAVITGVGAPVVVSGGVGSTTITVSRSITGVGASVAVAGGAGSTTVTANQSITGVGAAIIVAGGIGSAETTISTSITGIGAPVSVQGGVGSVTTTVSGIIAGQPAVVTVNGGVGSVTVTQNQAITGVGAPVVVAGGIGSASSTVSGIVTGVGASVTVAGGVGSTSITANQSITGVGAAITVAGGVGTASSGVAGIVTGVGASIVVAGGIGFVTATSNASITGVGTEVVVAGGIGSLTTTDSAAITGVAAEIVVAGGVGVASSGVSGIVTGVGASVAVNGGVGSLVTSVKISGAGASVPIAGGVGSTSITRNISVTGVGASITVAGGIGEAVSGGAGVVLGQAASIAVAGGIGAVSASAQITGVAAATTVAGGVGSSTATSNVSINGVGAAVAVAGGIGSTSTGSVGIVTGLAAEVVVASGVGSVNATSPNAVVSGSAAVVQVFGGIGSNTYGSVISGSPASISVGAGTGIPTGSATVTGAPAAVVCIASAGSVKTGVSVSGIAGTITVSGGIGVPAALAAKYYGNSSVSSGNASRSAITGKKAASAAVTGSI